MNANSPAHDAIARRAYELWEQAGQPAGRDQEFWLRAEAEVTAPPRAAAAVPPVIAPPVIPPPLKEAARTAARRPPRPRATKRS